MLRADLDRAREPWIGEAATEAEKKKRTDSTHLSYCDDAGRVSDFHSLRVTFASQLLRSGVDVRTAKDLMRHSTIAMTADVYACTMRGSMSEAVNKLPNLSTPTIEQLRATGTENADSVLALCLARDGTKQLTAVRGGAINHRNDDDSQPLKKTGTYGDSTGMNANGGALRAAAANLPPRGLEPLSSG